MPTPITSVKSIDLNKVAVVVFASLLSIELIIVILDALFSYNRLIDIVEIQNLTNITRETSLTSWFSSTQAFLVGLVLLITCFTAGKDHSKSWQPLGWAILSGFFFYMSFDDGTRFHERVGAAVRDSLPFSDEAGSIPGLSWIMEIYPSYPWQVVFLPFFGILGLFLLIFLWRELKSPFSKKLMLGGLSCYVLAVGIDFIEGLRMDDVFSDVLSLEAGFIRHFLKSFEEFIEMFGTTLFLTAFIKNLSQIGSPWHIGFSETK